jgi:hypothetical protein
MHAQILSLAALFLFQATALANSDCGTVDVLENVRKNGSPELKKYFETPLQQDGIGWCYAFSAAQLLSFHTGKTVSAVHLANAYNRYDEYNPTPPRKKDDRSSFGRLWDLIRGKQDSLSVKEYGLSGDAISAAQKDSYVCSESALPSNMNLLRYNKEKKLEWEFLEDMKAIRNLQRAAEEERSSRNSFLHPIYNRRMEKEFCSNTPSSMNTLFNQLSERQIKEIVAASAWKNMDEVLGRLIHENCKDSRVDISKFRFVDKVIEPNKRPGKKLMVDLNAALSSGKPVNISYEINRLKAQPSAGYYHMSLVVGRKKINGVCYYEVRNTWGRNGCGALLTHPDLKCDTNNGHYFVPHDLLASALYGVTYAK